MKQTLMQLALALAICFIGTATGKALDTRFLSGNHCMMRAEATARYILLPIEEKSEISSLRLIDNGTVVKKVNVRLAADNIDYYVPLDISKLKGKNLLLDIHVPGEKRAIGNIKEFVCWKNISVADSFDTTNREAYRPTFHHTPTWGWMNDPNGLFYLNGEWHLYYQWNPYGSQWENMHWGHSVSRDLVHWEHRGMAIAPDAIGTVFSGCCVVDRNNTAGFGENAIVAVYTSADESQTQSIAYSTDGGDTFSKYAGNPVITSDVPDFRDPHIFWNKDTKRWNMILAAGQEMRIYSSANLKEWAYESSFGLGYGCHDGVWECPDLMEVDVEGTNEKRWLLLCNINPGGPFGGSATQYFIGRFDGHRFVCEQEPSVTKWLDYGKDHYATVTFSDAPNDRHVAIGWMSNWQYANHVPTKQYRSANTIARDIFLFKDGADIYAGARPSSEYLAARGDLGLSKKFTVGKEQAFKLSKRPSNSYEIVINFIPVAGAKLQITLSNSRSEHVTMVYDVDGKTFAMDRKESGLCDFSEFFPTVTVAPVRGERMTELRLFVDRSSIEAFGGQGRMAMSNVVFPSEPYSHIALGCNKKLKITSLQSFELK